MNPSLQDPHLRALVRMALAEDHVDRDLTSIALVPEEARAVGRVVARAPGTIAGLFLLTPDSPLFEPFPDLLVQLGAEDGEAVCAGQVLAELTGPARDILGVERTLLNFLQRLSGIATLTASYVRALEGTSARIQETRKTCPGWRTLDKYAVHAGGGLNHRAHLGDQMLIKENHLVFTHGPGRSPDAVRAGIASARAQSPPDTVIEIEVEDLDQYGAALAAGPDIIMLDDFAPDAVRRAVEIRNKPGGPPLLEVSGGIDLDAARELARLGVDRISVGALTHSVSALDLAMDVAPLENPA